MAKAPTKAFVLPVNGRSAEVAKLKELIRKAGCEVTCDDAKPTDYEKCAKEADVLVVIICAETESDSAVGKLIAIASRTGKRVVGVWIPNAGVKDIPASINEQADAVITLDVDAVRKAICGGSSTWSTPEGTDRTPPKTPRHKG